MKSKKILFLLGFVLIAMFAICPNSVNAATNVSTYTALKNALEASGTDTINVTANINVEGTITVSGTKTVTGTYTLKNTKTAGTGANNMFQVPAGASITFGGGLTLDGNNKTSTTSSIAVSSGGNMTFNKVTITKSTKYGIYTTSAATASTITLGNGCVIDKTAKWGIVSYGKVIMNSGATIRANYIGIRINGASSSMTMNGGLIEGYKTEELPETEDDLEEIEEEGQDVGSGIYVNNGTLTINDGQIRARVKDASNPSDVITNGYAVHFRGTKAFKMKKLNLGENQSIFLFAGNSYIDIGENIPKIAISFNDYVRNRNVLKVTVPSTENTAAKKEAYYEKIRENISIVSEKGGKSWNIKENTSTGYMQLREYCTIIVNHIWEAIDDDTGLVTRQKVGNPVIKTGWAGETYTTSPITKANYVLKSTPSNASGTVTGYDIVVDYLYTRSPAYIYINYRDKATDAVIQSERIKGYIPDDYMSYPKDLEGYKLYDGQPAYVEKTFGNADNTIDWYYLKANKVTIKYIDETTGQSIPGYTDLTAQYIYGDTFNQGKLDTIYGYSYLRTSIEGASGNTMEGRDVTIIHYYSPSTSVVVKHIDKNTGRTLTDHDTVITGCVGQEYNTEPISIDGYAYNGKLDDHTLNTSGTMTAGVTTVEYYYVKLVDITIRYVNNRTKAAIEGYPQVVTTYQEKDTIDRKEVAIPGYRYSHSSSDLTVAGDYTLTITHYYDSETQVLVRHLDKYHKDKVLKEETINLVAGDWYETSPLPSSQIPSGYVYRGKDDDHSGVLKDYIGFSSLTVEYYYAKRVPVTVRFIDINTGNSLPGYPDVTETYDEGQEYDGKYYGNVSTYTYLNTQVEKANGNLVGPDPITITHYYSANAQIVVKHVDINNESIAVGAPQQIAGYVGSTYTTSPLSGTRLPTNYVYANKTKGETEGTITNAPKEIVYYYIKQVPVTIKYVNINNTSETIEETTNIYSQGDTFDLKQKDIAGYKYVRTENNFGTKVGANDVTVTHYYTKDATVTIKHLDKNDHTNILHEDTHLFGNAGEHYTATSEDLRPNRYVYREGDNSGNIEGTYTDEPIEVIFYYTKQSLVTVNYVDKVTGEVMESVSDFYDQNDVVDKKQKDINGYTYLETKVEADVNGKVGTEDVTVTHYYAKNAKIVVKYLDKYHNEKSIGDGYEIVGYEGKPYVANRLENTPSDYAYRSDNTGNIEGNMPAGTTEVIFYYVKRIPVTVQYVDKATNEVIETLTDLYDETTEFSKKYKTIDNYTFLEEVTTGTEDKFVGQNPVTVTHYYGRNTTLTVRHLDLNNNKIVVADEYIEDGYEGKDYSVEAEEDIPENYLYKGDNTGNTTGKMSREGTAVEFYYVKQVPVTVRYVDVNSEQPIREVIDLYDETATFDRRERTFENYTYLSTEINGSENNIVGPDDITVTHYYAKNTGVVVKYVDLYHPEIEVADRETIPGHVGLGYEAKNLEAEPEGYIYSGVTSNNTSGTMIDGQIVVEYYYIKQVPVTVNYVDKYSQETLESVTEVYSEATLLDKKEKDFNSYVYSDTNIEGTQTEFVGQDPVTITHNYIKESAVTVRFVDERTKQNIETSIVKELKEGEECTFYAKNIEGYVLADEDVSKTVTMGRESTVIVFYYKKIAEGAVAKYIDGMSNELLAIKHFDGNVGDYIIAETKTFDGYTLVEEPANKRVELLDTYQEFTFVYKKRVEVTVKGIVQETGKQLWEYNINGLEGNAYSTTYENVPGYEVVNTQDSLNGVYDRDVNEVIYYYKQLELKGDVNLDGFVNSTDAAIVLDYYKNGGAPEGVLQRGDMDNNNILNATDAAMILDIYKNN